MEYATNPGVNPNVGKTSQLAALTTLPQPVESDAHLIDAVV